MPFSFIRPVVPAVRCVSVTHLHSDGRVLNINKLMIYNYACCNKCYLRNKITSKYILPYCVVFERQSANLGFIVCNIPIYYRNRIWGFPSCRSNIPNSDIKLICSINFRWAYVIVYLSNYLITKTWLMVNFLKNNT